MGLSDERKSMIECEAVGQAGAGKRWCGIVEREFEAAGRAGVGLSRILDCN